LGQQRFQMCGCRCRAQAGLYGDRGQRLQKGWGIGVRQTDQERLFHARCHLILHSGYHHYGSR
jgi:hypothetical protein